MTLKQKLAAGTPCLNGWLAIPDAFATELMATAGYDSLTIDLQHGLHDYPALVASLQAAQSHPPTMLARIPWNEPGITGRVLDAGAAGVICPMINTAADCAAFVRACRYPPDGARSNGPIRAGLHRADYQATANAEILIIPMIETTEALANLEAILDVDGVDGVYVGPSDLGFSMGLRPLMDREELEVLRAYETIIAATGRRGQWAGLHNNAPAYAARMLAMGFRLATVNSDAGLLAAAARAAVAEARAAIA